MRAICTMLVHFMIPAILLAQQPTQRWSATRDLRIGSADDPTQTLTTVGSIVIGLQGNIYIAQPQDRLIRVLRRSIYRRV